jgi:bifunctional UDP-N-acetylglucosamine pyrophosphorylase/glucosamine-1-phosphate N-acetyltransferase
MSAPRIAVILAAGRGTRLRSRLPKVLHQAGGKPLLAWPLDLAAEVGCERRIVVANSESLAALQRAFPDPTIEWQIQDPPRGTGDALACGLRSVVGDAAVLVLSGDAPLLTRDTAERLLAHADAGAGAMAVAWVERPGSLGRVFANAHGALERIVEVADARPEELEHGLVNAGFYAFSVRALAPQLADLEPHNAQGELYLTDAVVAAAATTPVALVELEAGEALGVNSRADLARVQRALIERVAARLMDEGVTLLDPHSTVIDAEVTVGADTIIHAGVHLLGRCRIGRGCVLHAGAWIRSSVLEDEVEVLPYSVVDQARVGPGSTVGPFARLRPGTELADDVRVGNFVEVKNARLETGVRAGHLAYLGDATVGAGTNIGAGVVTCNYDGARKHHTTIGRDAFVGSDTMLVAPVTVGDRATTAAGSVITHDVPDDALAVARARQRVVPDWSKRRPRGEEH